jgi:hypothetical protein
VTICGVAAVSYLDSGGSHGATVGAATLTGGAVASVPRAGQAEGDATAMPEMAGQPVEAFMPGSAGGTRTTAAGSKASRSASPSSSKTSSPTPSTSPSASPTPTPPPASTGSCTNPSFSTTAQFGTDTLSPYAVTNDMWGEDSGSVSQTLYACNYSDWYVNVTASGGGSVLTYPDSYLNVPNTPEISSLSSVTSTFADSGPNSGKWEDAYDIWLNGISDPSGGSDELMIWTHNQDQSPAGSVQGTVTIDGQSWTAWRGSGGYMAFVANSNVSSGNLNLLAFFQYVINNGWVPSNSTLNQVDYGVEICSTNGQPATFSFSNFSVNVN